MRCGVPPGWCDERRAAILAANAADVEDATGRLDEGTLDRLRLDDARVEGLAAQLDATAELEPLERETAAWTLANGLRVSERRIPIGTVGANFEARPERRPRRRRAAPQEPERGACCAPAAPRCAR